ncbi:AEC family transporter [Clostridium sp. BJN0001]|uniref:AEC family transporter n=1 Tax=Clostridium sp. BJN0001 TaxID=2930219 RepID=UPI001FD58741|nr:AEC family transporter [Clostridium sp. BJN0001]
MESYKIVLSQVEIMFILIAVGFILVKKRLISKSSVSDISNILLYIVVPSLMIKAYGRENNKEESLYLIISFILAILFHIVAILISNIMIKKSKNVDYKIDRLAVVYSNCGFMAFPILSAISGDKGIFYGSAFVAVFNVFLWTHGIKIITEGSRFNLKKAVLNPGCIAVLLGIITYAFQIKYPVVINDSIDFFAGLNTPLAMIVVGSMLSDVKLKEFFNFKIMFVTFIRNLFAPAVFIALILLLKLINIKGSMIDVCIASILCASCPAAASITLVPSSFGIDAQHGAKIISFSTICSIVTLPVITAGIKILLK